ncbi:hypothetical protein TNIN_73341 [Trichonephila inaurata madagascariensis]|uniref:Uncharacterized protein n=1 Tax=Trichonephila inaurata madagascariensis TaxID=2747483 RepID=A0A8X6YSY6_9ARAC|nr:hypothetical protein TNIN_73341 [Trichonephila inaurata madagascariensis]
MIPQFGNSSKDDRPPPPRVTYYYQEPPLHFNDNQRVTGIPELPAHITKRLLSAPSDDRPMDAPRRTVRPRAAEKKKGKKAGKAQPPLRKPSECRSSAANASPPKVGMKRRNEVDDRTEGPKRVNNAAAASAAAASASASADPV